MLRIYPALLFLAGIALCSPCAAESLDDAERQVYLRTIKELQAAQQPVPSGGREWQKQLLAFESSGDALYDRFQQALLDELAQSPRPGRKLTDSVTVPDELLAQWDGEYGSDPRYWQMRVFELSQDAVPDEEQDVLYEALLGHWQNRAGGDPVLAWLVYLNSIAAQKDQVWAARINARQTQLAELCRHFPQESLFHYEFALHYFELGDWDHALPELVAGNSAADNRNLQLFPESFLKQRLRDAQAIGNKSAAGAVLNNRFGFSYTFGRNIRLNDAARDLQVRGNVGIDNAEAAVFHQFICRTALMDGASFTDALVAQVIAQGLLRYLLCQQAEVFTPDQREALWQLDRNWSRIKAIYEDENDKDPKESDVISQELARVGLDPARLAQSILLGDPADAVDSRLAALTASALEQGNEPTTREKVLAGLGGAMDYELDLNLRAVHFAWIERYARHEYFTEGARVQEALTRSLNFDWQSCTMPAFQQREEEPVTSG